MDFATIDLLISRQKAFEAAFLDGIKHLRIPVRRVRLWKGRRFVYWG